MSEFTEAVNQWRDGHPANNAIFAAENEIESLRQQLADMTAYADKRNSQALDLGQQLAECQATNGKLRAVISENHEWHKLYDIYDGYIESDLASSNSRALALPNDATALNELIAERTACLTAEISNLRFQVDIFNCRVAEDKATISKLTAEVERLKAELNKHYRLKPEDVTSGDIGAFL